MKSSLRFGIIVLFFAFSAALAEREVRIRLRIPAGVSHLEIEWVAEKDGPPSEPEVFTSGDVRRSLPDAVRFFRVRSVDTQGRPGPWSDFYPVEKFAKNAEPGARAALVTGDGFQFEIRPAGPGWQVRILQPASGITFRSGATTNTGSTYSLGAGGAVAFLMPGETVPFGVLISVPESGGSGLRFVTALGVRVEMARGIRIAVTQPGVPLK